MERPWLFLINVVAVVVIAFILAYRESARGRRGWPGMRMLTVLASISSVLLLLFGVSVYRAVPERIVPLEEKLQTWKPDASSAQTLDEYNHLVDVAITNIEAPNQYKLKLTPVPGQSYDYVSTTSSFMGGQQKPIVQIVDNYKVDTSLSDQGELLIEQKQEKLWGLSLAADKGREGLAPTAKCQLVVRDGDVYLARQEGSNLIIEKSPFRGAAQERIAFDLPNDGKPPIGKSWSTVTKTESLESTMSHTLVGFATVEGIPTAKIVSDGESKIPSAMADKMLTAAGSAKAKLPANFSLPPIHRKAVRYVELETGLVVRAESAVTTQLGAGAGALQTKTVTVVQRLSSP